MNLTEKEIFNKALENLKSVNNVEFDSDVNPLYSYDQMILMFTEGAKLMQKQDNWISVEEQRPPSIEYVNVWDGKYVGTRCFSKTHDFLNTANFIETTKVTHWQPLPKPPTS